MNRFHRDLADKHVPPHARTMLAQYDADSAVSRRFALRKGDVEPGIAMNQPIIAAAVAAVAAAAVTAVLRESAVITDCF